MRWGCPVALFAQPTRSRTLTRLIYVHVCAFALVASPPLRSYVTTDLGALFEAAGLLPDTKYLCSASKTLSFRKPE